MITINYQTKNAEGKIDYINIINNARQYFGDQPLEAKIAAANKKLGSNIPSFNTMPGCTCCKQAPCFKDCYFRHCLRYPAVLNSCVINTILASDRLNDLEAQLDAYFSKLSAPRFFRVHAGGDFVSTDYASMWARVAARHPGTNFLAYTKRFDIVRGVEFPSNFQLILSGWKGLHLPEDLTSKYPVAYCVDSEDEIPADALHCPGHCETCGMCWQLSKLNRDVYFIKHK